MTQRTDEIRLSATLNATLTALAMTGMRLLPSA